MCADVRRLRDRVRRVARPSRALAVLAAACFVPAAACAQRTDTTVSVQPNARVRIQNFAGSVTVRGWERNAVRVVAGASRRNEVRIRGGDASVTIATASSSGVPGPMDYEITVPVHASLEIGGTYTDISVEGTRGSVSATTVQGDVTLRGGDGVISLKSVEGTITLQDATGRVEVSGVNRGLVLRNVDGDISAETVNGSIRLDGVQSSGVEAVTVNGRVTYDGTIRDRGRYRFATHNGDIVVSVPERANATIDGVTYQGRFASRFDLPSGAMDGSGSARRRINFALGTGSARVELEAFQGLITLARPGDPLFGQR